MAGHRERWRRLGLAIAGQKVEPVKRKSRGPINYEALDRSTECIASPSAENETGFAEFLEAQEKVGHLARRGPSGVACEAGAPGMHWSFNFGAVVGWLLWLCKRGIPAGDRRRSACVRWLANEAGLNRAYRYKKRTIIPCPRGKDDSKHGPMKPLDGYRDTATALLSGEMVSKPLDYWEAPQALAVRTLRDLVTLRPIDGAMPLTRDELKLLFTAGLPKLYLSTHKVEERDGGPYFAWIEDTPEARACMGKDVINWVLVPEDGEPTWGYDWAPHPGQEAA